MLIYSMLTLAAAFPPLSFLSGRFVTFPVALASFCDRGWGSGVRRRRRRPSAVRQAVEQVVRGRPVAFRMIGRSQTAQYPMSGCSPGDGAPDSLAGSRFSGRVASHAGTRSSSPASQQIAVWGEMRWCRAITATS